MLLDVGKLSDGEVAEHFSLRKFEFLARLIQQFDIYISSVRQSTEMTFALLEIIRLLRDCVLTYEESFPNSQATVWKHVVLENNQFLENIQNVLHWCSTVQQNEPSISIVHTCDALFNIICKIAVLARNAHTYASNQRREDSPSIRIILKNTFSLVIDELVGAEGNTGGHDLIRMKLLSLLSIMFQGRQILAEDIPEQLFAQNEEHFGKLRDFIKLLRTSILRGEEEIISCVIEILNAIIVIENPIATVVCSFDIVESTLDFLEADSRITRIDPHLVRGIFKLIR